jgi:hypothetical protein
MGKDRDAGIEKLHEFAKANADVKTRIEWYRERFIQNLAEINLLKRRLQLAEKKIFYLEDYFWKKNRQHPSYSDLDLKVREILGKRKSRRGRKNDKTKIRN